MSNEIEVKCNNGTRFKIKWCKASEYTLYYRNDTIPLPSMTGGKVKGKWLYLESQPNYADLLSFLFEEIRNIDAKESV